MLIVIGVVGPGSRAALAMVVDVLVKLVYRIPMGSRAVRRRWPRAKGVSVEAAGTRIVLSIPGYRFRFTLRSVVD